MIMPYLALVPLKFILWWYIFMDVYACVYVCVCAVHMPVCVEAKGQLRCHSSHVLCLSLPSPLSVFDRIFQWLTQ